LNFLTASFAKFCKFSFEILVGSSDASASSYSFFVFFSFDFFLPNLHYFDYFPIIEFFIKKAEEAKKTGLELTRIAVEQAELSGRELSKEGRKKINESIAAAKKKFSSGEEHLAMLEKLGKLRKAGVITEKEFQTKKKEILKRI